MRVAALAGALLFSGGWFLTASSGLAESSPCGEKIPSRFAKVNSKNGVVSYKDGDASRVVAIKCESLSTFSMDSLRQSLEKAVPVSRIDEQRFYYDLAKAGVLTRTYLIQRKNHYLQVSFIASESNGELGNMESVIRELTGSDR